MKNLIFNENTKAALYLIVGLAIAFVSVIHIADKINFEKEKELVYSVSVQACFFSAMKQVPNPNSDNISEFCKTHSTKLKESYGDIATQMDKITDQKYSFWNYFFGQASKSQQQIQ